MCDMDASQRAAIWESRGSMVRVEEHDIWVLDLPPWSKVTGPPVVVLHGFPSCSFDWHAVLAKLSEHRRVVLFDLLGFGLSDKPDLRYTMSLQADIAAAIVKTRGFTEIALITHDLGDSIGGELLARSIEGRLGFDVVERVLTNGSIYIEMAHLTDGQLFLLSLPDERLEPASSVDGETFRAALRATYAPGSPVDESDLEAVWLMTAKADGHLLLPRTIRYIEERRANEARFTGAIEQHPSPLSIVWGDADPIAVHAMAERLRESVPRASLVTLDGVGHYPMVESAPRFADAVVATLHGRT
jgi:pimeloyl-ACP methyl ester carboxylesterase